MKLSELLSQISGARRLDPGDPEIRGVTCDSRSVESGVLFAAVRGANRDGHDFIADAVARGAAACLLEVPVDAGSTVRIQVGDAERALGEAAAAFWGQPSRQLRLVGITGTNGKTTTAYLLQHLLTARGLAVGRLGTVSYAYPSAEEPAALTTPDAPTLQRALARMVAEGADAVVMEVSSHALHRRRVEGCAFACSVFTNLTQDHLDYHGTMDAYYEAKRLLFTQCAPNAPAVINAEDPFGARLASELGGRAVTYGLERGDVTLKVGRSSAAGIEGIVRYPGGETALRLPLAGEFNARNALCAVAAAWAMGHPIPSSAAALSSSPQVPGRVEAVPDPEGRRAVYVDYAHTPDALDRVLETVRRFCTGRLLCVFGCGGDRDRGKRPLMAKSGARWCDGLVLTADNSRSEPTERILDEIEIGLPVGWTRTGSMEELGQERHVYARVPDRAEAIRWAIRAAGPGDAVVIAGKGHEATQTIGPEVYPFDDRLAARAALAEQVTS